MSSAALDILPVVDKGLGNSSYVVDLGDGSGLVMDPERDPDPYLAAAERRGLRLRWTAETHLHADFVSGGRELAAEGAKLLAPEQGHLAFDHHGVEDGDELDLGGLTLGVIATPGHTPEHVAYLLSDGARPLALFSGGTLIAGGVARPDLVSPELTEELARAAYRSISDRLLELPDDLVVYPTHGAGSFCSVAPTDRRTTTIGLERRANPLLLARDEDEFVALLLAGLGSFPSYFLRLRSVNQAGPHLYGRSPPPPPALSPTEFGAAFADGAEVVDIRTAARFAAGHVPGSVSIELRDAFASWLGWLIDPDKPLLFVADPGQDLGEATRQALKIGYEQLAGYLDGGVTAWEGEGRSVARIPVVGPQAATTAAAVVDVRQRNEWDEGHVPGARHIELGSLAEGATALRTGGTVLVHCAHGQRAMTGASLLARAGVAGVAATSAGVAELTAAAP